MNRIKVGNILGLFVIIVNTFMGFSFFYIESLRNKSRFDKQSVIWFYASVVFFVSLFNGTKIPENDLAWIVELYDYAGGSDFSTYLTLKSGGAKSLSIQ